MFSYDIRSREDIKSGSSHWLTEGANLAQLRELSHQVELMTNGCEEICPNALKKSLKSTFNIQVIIYKLYKDFYSKQLLLFPILVL